jgi:iron complex outermembrane receptor protein
MRANVHRSIFAPGLGAWGVGALILKSKISWVAVVAALLPAQGMAQTRLPGFVIQAPESASQDGQGTATPAQAETASSPVEGYVGSVTATGSKTATPITEIPQSISIVGREELEDRGATKVDEALRYTAGVFAQPFGADGDTNWIYIRGFDATQTGIFQDGLQQFSFAFGGFYIDPFALERIEVLRGASSVLYGGSNPGGLINNVSKHADGERLRYLESGINDAGNGWVGFDIGDRANPSLDYRVTGRIAGGDGYTDFEEDFRGFIAPTFTWHVDRDTDFTVLANYTAIDAVHGGGGFLPYVGTVIDAPFGRIDPEANFTEPGIDDYQRRQASIGYEAEHRFAPGWAVRQNVRYGYSDLHEVAPFTFGYADPVEGTLNRLAFQHDTTVNNVLVDNQLEGRAQTGPVQHRLLVGSDYKWFELDQLQQSVFGTPISATDPVYGAEQPPFAFFTDQVITLQQLGVYAQDQLRFGDGWIVTLGGRFDHVDIEAEGSPAFEISESEWSGRAGVAYEFANGLTPYASVSTFFNPQIGTLPNGDGLVPESGEQFEVGLKYKPTWFNGLFTVAWFDLTKQNVLVGNSVTNTQEQIGEVNSRGFEFEAKANVTENLKLTASLTALNLKVTEHLDGSLVGKQPFLVPEVYGGIALDYTFREGMLAGVTIGGGVRYIGESFADEKNLLVVPDVTLFDAKIGYAWDNWGIDLNITNLMDEEYVAGCQRDTGCAYGEGRVIKLKTHVTW